MSSPEARGGTGNDRFVFDRGGSGHVVGTGSGADILDLSTAGGGACLTVLDFAPGLDLIRLDGRRIDLNAPPPAVAVAQTADGTVMTFGTTGAVLFDGLVL